MFGGVELNSDFKSATIQIAGRTIHVTEKELSWGDNQKLELPANWQRLELVHSWRQIDVLIDDTAFGRIPIHP
jgi:hypothetical protein